MKVSELIEKLKELPQDSLVAMYDAEYDVHLVTSVSEAQIRITSRRRYREVDDGGEPAVVLGSS